MTAASAVPGAGSPGEGRHGWRSIPGWTCPQIERLYAEVAERPPVSRRLRPWRLVEVGVAYGRSLALLNSLLPDTAQLYGVDVWEEHMGGDNLPPETFAALRDLGSPMAACAAELQRVGVAVAHADATDDHVHLIKSTSVGAAVHFGPESCDFVFLDDRHEYEDLSRGIAAWWPKLRPGGVLAGHDINDHYPGVERAVREAVLTIGPVEIRVNADGWGGVWIARRSA